MRDLTRLFAKTMQTALPMALVGMLSLCVACTKLSPAERAFVKQYEKDNSGEKVVKIVLRPFEGEGKYKGRFTARFKKHGSMKEYEQGVHLIYAHGDCYYETFSSATTVSGATALGNITAIGNGTVSRDTSCDDLWPFSVSDEADDAHEDFLEYLDSQRKLANNLRSGRNPATGEASWKIRTRDQRLSDALQQRYLESAFFKSFDPKWADDHKDQVQEVYRQIAGRGRSPVTAGYLTPNLMASAGGLDVGYANAAGLKDMMGSDGSLTLFMPGATEADPPRPFDPAEIDAARFHSLVMYEQKRYDDEMAKVAANVADWDNFIKNAPNSIRKSYAYVDDINEHGGVVRRVANRSQAYRDDAEDNLRREHELRMSALAASPAAQRLATANALRLYKLATGNDLAHDYVETGPNDMYDKDLYPGISEDNFYGAPNFAAAYLDKTSGGLGWVAKPGSDLWTLSDDELRKKAKEVFSYYVLSRDGATLE